MGLVIVLRWKGYIKYHPYSTSRTIEFNLCLSIAKPEAIAIALANYFTLVIIEDYDGGQSGIHGNPRKEGRDQGRSEDVGLGNPLLRALALSWPVGNL
jgi:hypothetical protein